MLQFTTLFKSISPGASQTTIRKCPVCHIYMLDEMSKEDKKLPNDEHVFLHIWERLHGAKTEQIHAVGSHDLWTFEAGGASTTNAPVPQTPSRLHKPLFCMLSNFQQAFGLSYKKDNSSTSLCSTYLLQFLLGVCLIIPPQSFLKHMYVQMFYGFRWGEAAWLPFLKFLASFGKLLPVWSPKTHVLTEKL